MARPRKHSDAAIIAALEKVKGLVYLAAKILGCDPGTTYDRAKVSPAVRTCIANQEGLFNDTAVMKPRELVLAGNLAAIKYQLSAKARDRGYGNKPDVKDPVPATVPVSEERKAALTNKLAEAMRAQLG